jgi:hypothetical protein
MVCNRVVGEKCMKTLLAALIVGLALPVQASVEGRLSEALSAASDSPRRASYQSDSALAGDAEALVGAEVHGSSPVSSASKKLQATGEQSVAAASVASFRSADALAERASWFRLYDAGRTLLRDRDSDGHHSEFQIRFAADVISGDALVYAKLYLRRVGDSGAWRHYYTTQDFWIYGQSGSDDYFVTTTLDAGYPAGRYDVLIDLYEVGYSGIAATLTAYDDASLADLPLEERGLDVPIGMPSFGIGAVTTTLLTDNDDDGFYSRYRVAFDPISSVGAHSIYAELWVRPRGGDWLLEHRSANFDVDAAGTEDTYAFTGELVSGYSTAHYDVQVDLYHTATGLLIASAGSERPELSRVPLEDQSRDRYISPPSSGHDHGDSYGDSYSEEGGGATPASLLAALLLLALLRMQVGLGNFFQRFAGLVRRTLLR